MTPGVSFVNIRLGNAILDSDEVVYVHHIHVDSNPFRFKKMYVRNADVFCHDPSIMCQFLKNLDMEEERIQNQVHHWDYIKYKETQGNGGVVFLTTLIAGALSGGIGGAAIGFFGSVLLTNAIFEKTIYAKSSKRQHPQPEPVDSRIARVKDKMQLIREKMQNPDQTVNVQHLRSAEGYFNWVLNTYGHPNI